MGRRRPVEREVAGASEAPVGVRVLSSTIAYGSLGLGGDLGYAGKRVSVAGAADAGVISAHGPSEVRIATAAGTRLRLRGAINDDACGAKIAAHFIVEDGHGRRLAVPGLALPGAPTPAVSVIVPPDQQLVLRCDATTRHACHAVWVVEGVAVSSEEPWAALRVVTNVAVDLARTLPPGPDDAHELYLQTSAARAELALRSVSTHLLVARVRPKRVVVVCPDGGGDEIAARLPPWCEVWSGRAGVDAGLAAAGVAAEARARIAADPSRARDAITRLALGEQVIVSDDGLLWFDGPDAPRAEADPARQATLVEGALREHHERARVAAGRRRAPRKIAALITIRPSDAEALDLCLERAAEVGALQAWERLVVFEAAFPSGNLSSQIRAVCDRHGAVHRRGDPGGADPEEDPPPNTIAAGALLRQLGALARDAPDAEWLLTLDPGLVLAGDLWTHLVRRGIDAHADVSANLRTDSQFDPNGHLLLAGSAFSSATALALGALAEGANWRRIAHHLVAESDARGDLGIAVALAARLLGRRIVAPERRRGLLSVREVVNPDDPALWEPTDGVAPLAFSVTGDEDGAGRVRRLLERVRRGPKDDPAVAAVSQMRTKFCRVLSAQVGGGTLRIDGTLGYDGGCCPRPLCHTPLAGTSLLSAHGPSRLELEVDEPIELFGFLNASARFDPHNPVEFWVDWNFIGEASRPGTVSSTIRLDRGPHVLVVACPHRDTRHTLWAMRPAVGAPAERRLTVVTIAAYPPERVPAEIGILARSAHKHGIHLEVCFVGEGYASHTEMKIHRLRRSIAALPGDHILYTDGRDCFFLSDAARIERQFASLGAPIVVSSEAEAWPVGDPSWAERFPNHPGGCNWINAGQWMGERTAILNALETLADLDDRARRPSVAGELGDLARCRGWLGDDQLLWQAADLNRLFPLALDHEGRLFRNVNTLDMQLVDNRCFAVDDGPPSYRVSGQQPCVLHFSGWGAAYAMHQWGARFGGY